MREFIRDFGRESIVHTQSAGASCIERIIFRNTDNVKLNGKRNLRLLVERYYCEWKPLSEIFRSIKFMCVIYFEADELKLMIITICENSDWIELKLICALHWLALTGCEYLMMLITLFAGARFRIRHGRCCLHEFLLLFRLYIFLNVLDRPHVSFVCTWHCKVSTKTNNQTFRYSCS